MRPMNLPHSEAAVSRRSARTVPRSRLRATPRAAAPVDAPTRRARRGRLRGRRGSMHDQDDRRAEDDDEQRREDAPDEREQHLDRRLGRLLLGALAALDAQLLGLDLEHLADRDAQLLGLDDRADEVGERRDLGARDDVPQRLAARLADADLGQRPPELLGERALELLDDLAERRVEAEAGADGDRQQVEGVRDLEQDRLLALLDAAAEPELRERCSRSSAPTRIQQEVERERADRDRAPRKTNRRMNRIAADDRRRWP